MLQPLLLALALVQGAAHHPADPTPTPTPDSSPRPAPVLAEEVTVTASRIETALRDIAASVAVLREADIQDSVAVGSDELLRRIPGFSLIRQDSALVANPTTNAVSLRGLGGSASSRTLVLVDGLPLTDPMNSTVAFQRIPMELIDRVEVVRGGGAVAWGNLALGGVINIRTAVPAKENGRIGLSAGEAGFFRASGGVSRAREKLSGSLLGVYSDYEGYQTVRADQRGLIDEPSGQIQRNLDARGQWRPTDRLLLRAGTSVFTGDNHRGSPYVGGTGEARTGRFDAEFDNRSGTTARFQVAYTDHDGSNRSSTIPANRNSETPSADQHSISGSTLMVGGFGSRLLGGGVLLSAGFDTQVNDGTLAEFNTPAAGLFTRERVLHGRQRFAGAYVQVSAPVGSRWRVQGSGRIDSIRYDDLDRRESLLASGEESSRDQFVKPDLTTASPSVGLVFQASSNLSLRASAYRAFRAPTINELITPFRARGNVVGEGNALLQPEFVSGVEAGFLATGASRRASVSAFFNTVEDPIVTATVGTAGPTATVIAPCGVIAAGGACRQRQNVGKVRSIGVEADYQERLGALTLDASYLWNKAHVVDAGGISGLDGNVNRNAPRHQLSVGASLRARLLTAALRGRYVSERFDDDVNSLAVAGFFIADLRLSRDWTSRLQTFAAVENIFDTVWETGRTTTLVTIGPPRLVRVGASLRF